MSSDDQQLLEEFLSQPDVPADVNTAYVCSVPKHFGMCFGAGTTESGVQCFGVYRRPSYTKFDEIFHVPGVLARTAFPLCCGAASAAGAGSLVAASMVLTDADTLLLLTVRSASEEEDGTTVVVHSVQQALVDLASDKLLLISGSFPDAICIVTEKAVAVCSATSANAAAASSSDQQQQQQQVYKLETVGMIRSSSSSSDNSNHQAGGECRVQCAGTTADKSESAVVIGKNRLVLASDVARAGKDGASLDSVAISLPVDHIAPGAISAICIEKCAGNHPQYAVVLSVATRKSVQPVLAFLVESGSSTSSRTDSSEKRGSIVEHSRMNINATSLDDEMSSADAGLLVSSSRSATMPCLSTENSSSNNNSNNSTFTLFHVDSSGSPIFTTLNFPLNGAGSATGARPARAYSAPIIFGEDEEIHESQLPREYVFFDASRSLFVAADSRGNTVLFPAKSAAVSFSCSAPINDDDAGRVSVGALTAAAAPSTKNRRTAVVATGFPSFGNLSRVVRSCHSISIPASEKRGEKQQQQQQQQQQAFWLCDGEGGVGCCISKDDEDHDASATTTDASNAAQKSPDAMFVTANDALPFLRITSVASLVQQQQFASASSSASSSSSLPARDGFLFVVTGLLKPKVSGDARPAASAASSTAAASSFGASARASNTSHNTHGAVVISCIGDRDAPPRVVSDVIELPMRPKCTFCAALTSSSRSSNNTASTGNSILVVVGSVSSTAFIRLGRRAPIMADNDVDADNGGGSAATANASTEKRLILFVEEEMHVLHSPNASAVVGIFELAGGATAESVEAGEAARCAEGSGMMAAASSSSSFTSATMGARETSMMTLVAPEQKPSRSGTNVAVAASLASSSSSSCGSNCVRIVTIERGGSVNLFRVATTTSFSIVREASFSVFALAGVDGAVRASILNTDGALPVPCSSSSSSPSPVAQRQQREKTFVDLDTLLVSSWRLLRPGLVELSCVFAGGQKPIQLRCDLKKLSK